MADNLPLVDRFTRAVPAEIEITADDALGFLLQELIDRARAGWPELDLDEGAFVAHVAGGLTSDDVAGQLAAVHAADLWLAYGCSTGDEPSINAFDREVLSQVGMLLGRMQPTPQLVDDVRQQ